MWHDSDIRFTDLLLLVAVVVLVGGFAAINRFGTCLTSLTASS